MRPTISVDDSIATASLDQTDASFLIVLGQFLSGLWIEVSVVIVALYIYLGHSKRSRSRAAKLPPEYPEKPQWPPSKMSAEWAGYKASLSSAADEGQRVQRLVVSLMQKANKTNPIALLEQYQELAKACGSKLRQHLSDDQNARSMYLGLIGCAISSAATERAPEVAVRKWTSQLLSDMRAFGFPRCQAFYAAVLQMFVNGQLFQEALWLHEAMIADALVATSPMLISFLSIAVSCGENAQALSFFEMLAHCAPPSVRTIMTVLRVYSTSKDWQGAAKLLDRLDSLGTRPDNLILNHVLGLCISAGELDGAERLMQRWSTITDVISCNIFLKGCTQQGNLARAETLLATMASAGPSPNIISYNTVMDCAVRSMQMLVSERTYQGRDSSNRNAFSAGTSSSDAFQVAAQRPWQLLDQLMKQGLQPDRYTCSTLVKGMHLAGCSIADIDRAVALLNEIGSVALQAPSLSSTGASPACNARLLEVLFNTLLDACNTVKDLDRMTQIFGMMQQFNVSVSAVTYGTLIKAFGQAGRLSRCHEVWEDMRRACIHPTIVTYGCYIDACLRNDDSDHAELMFESMAGASSHGVRPNAVIYTSLIRGFAHSKQPRKALELYRRMQIEGVQANSVTFNSILDVVARQLSEPSVLQEVIDDMCKASIAPDAVTYSILLKASCNSGNIQNALSLFRQIHSNGLVFDQTAFNTLLLACSKAEQIQDAEDIFQEMCRAGMTPTHVTTSIMVKMFGKAKMLDKAVALTDFLAKEYGQLPNLFVYTCLIQACVHNKQVRRSWEIFNQMVISGVEPDAITFGTVIHGCVYLNKFSYAMSLVRHAYKLPLPAGVDAETPFVAAAPPKHPVLLQQDVLQALLSAMQRKDQTPPLLGELEDIMAQNASVATNGSAKGCGGKQNRRAPRPGAHVA